jgi:hypothetical protein
MNSTDAQISTEAAIVGKHVLADEFLRLKFEK